MNDFNKAMDTAFGWAGWAMVVITLLVILDGAI